ncbi:hypothetical protein [Rhizorhabdus sp.]|uniref:hypothetical protein n=1 Tax=Rhizorhabdus sp. TaxID=1968843 RepID=UPI0019BD3AC2|nr:hypothetical protein [Rhizorhabdus sp.]MBD3760127.1 hypothetical protein [Rhizorhabdus sp.]
MALRTTPSSVSFSHPFALKGVDGPLPAGSYEVETEEEIIETLHRMVYVRVATLLIIRSPGMTRTVTVDPGDLQMALERDRAMAG